MTLKLNHLPELLQRKISAVNADINKTIHPEISPNISTGIPLEDFRDFPQGDKLLFRPHIVYFKLVKSDGELGEYVFDYIETYQ